MNRSFILAVALVACTTSTPVPDAGDAADDATRSALVARDCAHLKALGCAAAAPTTDGHACAEVEAAELDAGVPLDWACRAKASTCAAIEVCK
jgi:hypothetical protein